MFDREPYKPLIALGKESPPESFEARVLRELAAINDRLTKLDAALMYQHPMPLSSFEAQLVYASFNHASTVNDPGHASPVNPCTGEPWTSAVARKAYESLAPGSFTAVPDMDAARRQMQLLPSRQHEADLPGVEMQEPAPYKVICDQAPERLLGLPPLRRLVP